MKPAATVWVLRKKVLAEAWLPRKLTSRQPVLMPEEQARVADSQKSFAIKTPKSPTQTSLSANSAAAGHLLLQILTQR